MKTQTPSAAPGDHLLTLMQFLGDLGAQAVAANAAGQAPPKEARRASPEIEDDRDSSHSEEIVRLQGLLRNLESQCTLDVQDAGSRANRDLGAAGTTQTTAWRTIDLRLLLQPRHHGSEISPGKPIPSLMDALEAIERLAQERNQAMPHTRWLKTSLVAGVLTMVVAIASLLVGKPALAQNLFLAVQVALIAVATPVALWHRRTHTAKLLETRS